MFLNPRILLFVLTFILVLPSYHAKAFMYLMAAKQAGISMVVACAFFGTGAFLIMFSDKWAPQPKYAWKCYEGHQGRCHDNNRSVPILANNISSCEKPQTAICTTPEGCSYPATDYANFGASQTAQDAALSVPTSMMIIGLVAGAIFTYVSAGRERLRKTQHWDG